MKNEKLTPFDRALATVLSNVIPLRTTYKKGDGAFGMVLREGIKADRPLPPFNRSAMDGYAVRYADLTKGVRRFFCVGALEAGSSWKKKVGAGKCLKIMTGAPVPEGLDAVIKVEDTRIAGGMVEYFGADSTAWLNIHRRGADIRQGGVVLRAGQPLSPGRIAVAAAAGKTKLMVTSQVKVAVFSSGNELVPTADRPAQSQIRDSNGPFLMARLAQYPWVSASFGGIVPDEPGELRRRLSAALKKSDVVIISGGVSMGERDFTPRVLQSLGVERKLYKSAIRPGKPVWFGARGGVAVFGLPGNPVSVAVTFHEFVFPAIRKMAGFEVCAVPRVRLPLSAELAKRHPLREFRVACLSADGASVAPVPGYGGSGDFFSASKSDGVIVVPEKTLKMTAGSVVEFHPWNP